MTKTILTVVSFFLSNVVAAQTTKRNSCYQETIGSREEVFTKTLYYPNYRGNDEALNLFLINEFNILAVAKLIPASVRVFEDSVRVKFVISRTAQMSDISVGANNPALAVEIKNAFIKSACNWLPGGTERPV